MMLGIDQQSRDMNQVLSDISESYSDDDKRAFTVRVDGDSIVRG